MQILVCSKKVKLTYNFKFFDHLKNFIFEVHPSVAQKWYIYQFMLQENIFIEIILSMEQVLMPEFLHSN